MPLGKLSRKQIESAYTVLKELQNVSEINITPREGSSVVALHIAVNCMYMYMYIYNGVLVLLSKSFHLAMNLSSSPKTTLPWLCLIDSWLTATVRRPSFWTSPTSSTRSSRTTSGSRSRRCSTLPIASGYVRQTASWYYGTAVVSNFMCLLYFHLTVLNTFTI